MGVKQNQRMSEEREALLLRFLNLPGAVRALQEMVERAERG